MSADDDKTSPVEAIFVTIAAVVFVAGIVTPATMGATLITLTSLAQVMVWTFHS